MKKKSKNSDIPVVMLLAQVHEYKLQKGIKIEKMVTIQPFLKKK